MGSLSSDSHRRNNTNMTFRLVGCLAALALATTVDGRTPINLGIPLYPYDLGVNVPTWWKPNRYGSYGSYGSYNPYRRSGELSKEENGNDVGRSSNSVGGRASTKDGRFLSRRCISNPNHPYCLYNPYNPLDLWNTLDPYDPLDPFDPYDPLSPYDPLDPYDPLI